MAVWLYMVPKTHPRPVCLPSCIHPAHESKVFPEWQEITSRKPVCYAISLSAILGVGRRSLGGKKASRREGRCRRGVPTRV
uniref:Uncharacterized protein n=1 Tax=Ixodes ricinus TaxID=34613 RepID=A0A6B0UDH4_IXORI